MVSYLQTENISRRIGERILFENITLNINEGEKVALVAKNGTGKTSLFDMLAGIYSPDTGSITYKNDLTTGYLTQEPELNLDNTVLEECLTGDAEITDTILAYEQAMEQGESEKLNQLIIKMDELDAWDYENKAKTTLSVLKLSKNGQKVSTLSGGQKKRLALAKVLLQEPDLLFLDEPTNHLDLEMIEWLEKFLSNTKSAIFMVTHDRYFLDRVCNVIYEMDNNLMYRYNGNYAYYLEKRDERLQSQQASVDKAKNLMRTELEWVRRMPKARGTKAKYRMDAFEELKKKASLRFQHDSIDINVHNQRLGNKICEIKDLSKSFGELNIFSNFSYTFNRFEKTGIIGKNGSGKSTLLNIITQKLQPDSGSITIGQTIKFGFYEQGGIHFNENTKVIDVVREIAEVVNMGNGNTLSVSQFLNHFLFPPSTHYNYVYKLSGGEKRRLYLVTVLMQNPNFLILDEPTNDLDIMTLNVLEDYLANFRGNVLIVSHDRYFMDKIVDNLFVLEGDGHIRSFPGTYTQYRFSENEKTTNGNNRSENKKANTNKTPDKQARLTYKERIELEGLEKEIDSLENKKVSLEQKLTSPGISNDDMVDLSSEIGSIMETLDELSIRWMELSEKENL